MISPVITFQRVWCLFAGRPQKYMISVRRWVFLSANMSYQFVGPS